MDLIICIKQHGVIEDSEISAQNLYKSEKSFYLVNGSTCGILSWH
jgi:arginine/lysine/ornithine decarboxylase